MESQANLIPEFGGNGTGNVQISLCNVQISFGGGSVSISLRSQGRALAASHVEYGAKDRPPNKWRRQLVTAFRLRLADG